MPTDPRLLTHPGLQPLWDSMDRDRRQQQFAAVALLLGSLFLVVVGVTSRYLGWAILGGALCTASLWWLFRILTEQPLAFWRKQLREEPESIVWVYGIVTERMPFGFKTTATATLHLIEDDGDIHAFGMRPDELKLVTKTLNRVLHEADFGYSPEKEMKYRGEVTNFKGRDRFNEIKEP
jgi:hypothetical protein